MKKQDLQRDVLDTIKWEPLLKSSEICVSESEGIITLTGTVDSYSKKVEAERAAKNVAGVKAVIGKIEVKLFNEGKTTDIEIAREILNAYRWTQQGYSDKVKIDVENGWVTLDGQLPWNFQKDSAKNIVANLNGVKGVTNNIIVKSEEKDDIEKSDIEDALERNWSLNNEQIMVKVSGSKVILLGKVKSFYQKDEAERIAWNAPGVKDVENELMIVFDY